MAGWLMAVAWMHGCDSNGSASDAPLDAGRRDGATGAADSAARPDAISPEGCEAHGDCSRTEVCRDGVCVAADCLTFDECALGEICLDGRCVAIEGCGVEGAEQGCGEGEICEAGRCVARPSCAQEDACPLHHRCVEGECVFDNRARCAEPADCATLSQICQVLEGVGRCVDHAEIACAGNADCLFDGGPNAPALQYVCSDGRCRAAELDGCALAQDCAAGLDCQIVGYGGRCLTPCQSHQDCGPSMRCEPELDHHCWYNLCGAGDQGELSGGFAGVVNGRLGGGCRADAPPPIESTPCAGPDECGAPDRCNDRSGRCERLCHDQEACIDEGAGWQRCRALAGEAPDSGARCEEHPDCDPETPICHDAACVMPCVADGGCRESARCTGALDEVAGGFCESAPGVCEPVALDGRCAEVNAGPGEWVGLCIEGGWVQLDGVCRWGVERGDNERACAGGLICTGSDAEGLGRCRPTCALGGHGRVACAEGTVCYAHADGFGVCLVEGDGCDPAALEACGAEGRCTFGGWQADVGVCLPLRPPAQRRAVGESCLSWEQCPDGAVCLGEPTTCVLLCRPGVKERCVPPTQCVSVQALSEGSIAGSPYGLCVP